MEELVALYRARLAEKVPEIRALRDRLPDPDADTAVRRAAHRLRGSGAAYGFLAVSEAAGQVEDAAATDLADRIEALLQVMNAEATPA